MKKIKLPKNIITKILPKIKAEAHCDIPCGIYEPIVAKIAAKTVLRMMLQLKDLPLPKDWSKKEEVLEYFNAITRRIHIKEEHAEIVKKELRILWGDFFKEEHLQKYPDLHSLFWKGLKLASQAKQSVNEEIAKKLCETIDEIAKIFYEVKNDPDRFQAYKEISEKLF